MKPKITLPKILISISIIIINLATTAHAQTNTTANTAKNTCTPPTERNIAIVNNYTISSNITSNNSNMLATAQQAYLLKNGEVKLCDVIVEAKNKSSKLWINIPKATIKNNNLTSDSLASLNIGNSHKSENFTITTPKLQWNLKKTIIKAKSPQLKSKHTHGQASNLTLNPVTLAMTLTNTQLIAN